jgi:hypothetical protein
MPAKKAAKKAAKKVAKKFVHHHPSHDLRRAYEHLGRVDILEGALAGSSYLDVNALANLAQQQLASGHAKNAADLLRAAEHISFAALAPTESAQPSSRVSPELKDAISAELDRLTRRAEDRWSEYPEATRKVIADLYSRTLEHARQAFSQGSYRPALELARAAEALTHVNHGLPATLPGDRELTRRLAS